MEYGTLKIYHNDFSGGESGTKAFEGNVVITDKQGSKMPGSFVSFRILEVLEDNGYFRTKAIPGQYKRLSAYDGDLYSFDEAKGDDRQRLVESYNVMKLAEYEAPWKFSGRLYERTSEGDVFPIYGKDIEVKLWEPNPNNLEEAKRIAYERHPLYFFGGTVWKDFVGGALSIVPCPESFMEKYQTQDVLEALLAFGKDKGWGTSLVEELIEARDAGELEL